MNYYNWLSKKIYERAARKMCEDCRPFIEKGAKILDIGCGFGIVAEKLGSFFDAKVYGVDICDRRKVNIRYKTIDGEDLPFSENEFDVAFISYVLHHTTAPEKLISEAKRVAAKSIIIFEDLPEGAISKNLCRVHGFLYKLYNPEQTSPLSFKTTKFWENIFDSLNLSVFFKRDLRSLFFIKKIQFVLEKK
jgi:2-polyprenyl-3-methyl-5-hydroxy-6-metoxy-1,4-benzoquinol methylase